MSEGPVTTVADQINWHEFVTYWKLTVVKSTTQDEIIEKFTKSLVPEELQELKNSLGQCRIDDKKGQDQMGQFLRHVGGRMKVMGNFAPRIKAATEKAATETTGEETTLDNNSLKQLQEAVKKAEEGGEGGDGGGEEQSGEVVAEQQ